MKGEMKCWEFFECDEIECPVYRSKELGCWLVSGTHCRDEIQGKFLEKIEMCLECEPFKANVDISSLEDTLKVVHEQFIEFREMVDERDRDLEGISMELALGLSEVFEALQKIASGDPSVKISEKSDLDLITKLKHMVNLTGENLAEMVDLSHEFAIGLAEHFDTLHRVSKGDLAARVSGGSQVELLESLKKVTNQMINSVSREMTERKRAEEALQTAHHDLEIRVEERTAEFTRANVLLKQEISERKRAEEALRDSEERYRTLFEDSRDAIYISARTGEFLDINQSCLDLFGYAREEMIGLDAREIYVNPDDRPRFQKKIESKGSVTDYEVKFRKKDKTEMDCLLTASVRHAKDGSVLGYQGIIRDITERKRLEAQLQQAQKMEAIGTLAGGIAHDFNNLLMGIQGNVSLLLTHMDAKDPHYERLKNTEKQIQSGAKLTSHLLGYARKGRYEVKPLDLNDLVGETSETFGRTKREIAIHREFAGDLFAVEADAGQIEQVLWNLFVNAADAMPGGGDLILRTKNVTHKDIKSKLYDTEPGNYVSLTVTDTGAGMDKKIMGRIFDPFFTTKERGRGTGLGLASAYGIIKGHDGYIHVTSREGHGASFSIYLPASEKTVREALRHADGLIAGTETVLFVDDEEAIRDVGEELLQAMGYSVLLARDGKEAVELYEKNGDNIDIVLLDIVMPHMGGSEVYEKMKGINPNIKVLLLSGYSIDGEATDILDRGCDGFIQKPFTMKELSGKIREIMGTE
ncbi:MAG: PAS domain S-box protein [Deltaproteobacteria bacterium]|nr:PAS domain S-box protein [Deltaproteobacteria bacterium]